MSSFLTRGLNGEEPNQSEALEEQYKRLMPKIGRDFVTIGDLEEILRRILLLVDPLGVNAISIETTVAQALADRYKLIVENNKPDTESKRDLVKIDED